MCCAVACKSWEDKRVVILELLLQEDVLIVSRKSCSQHGSYDDMQRQHESRIAQQRNQPLQKHTNVQHLVCL